MAYSLLFFTEIIFLFFFSQWVSKLLSSFLIRITGSVKITINVLSFIFLPGVMVHELAHWLVASFLFVRTGDIEFLPQINGDVVKLGSVAVEKTDPIRKALIGVAPVIVGILILLLFFTYFSAQVPAFNWQTLLLVYFSFEVGNTMFSSRKDLEGTLFVAIALLFMIGLFYVFKIQIHEYILNFLSQPSVTVLAKKLSVIFFVPLTVDILICLIAAFLRKRVYY